MTNPVAAVAAPSRRRPHLGTRAIHGGLAPDPVTGAILTPIHQSTTFVQEAIGVSTGYTYTRTGNPTVAALERNLGTLEDALPAVCFSTGMAALTGLLLACLRQGDRVVVGDVVYGGTVRLLEQVFGRLGVHTSFVDLADPLGPGPDAFADARLVIVETPANPTLKLTDIERMAERAREAGALLAVDNTFLTAALQRPLDLGADVSVYSTTKFVEGHNATVGGALITRHEQLHEQLRFIQNAAGCPQSPFEAWLTLRGVKTLPIRMQEHSRRALEVARHLETHPGVARVHHPDLDSFPQRELARRQQVAGGGVVALELTGGVDAAKSLVERVRLCRLAENLGAVETLVTHPATMTHADVPPAHRRAVGITDGLVRLSVGLEDPEDIVADLEQALEHAAPREGRRS
ncbi:MAG: trans-sulfuration enzyme family protein [Planctomycetota bacterium]|jgi:cystathionine beta-lyase/cystathionine gamma-synthase